MLAELYATWLARAQPTTELRAAIVLSVFEDLAWASRRAVPEESWLRALARGQSCPEDLRLPPPAPQEEDSLAARTEMAHALGRALDTLLAVEAIGVGSGQKVLRRRLGSYFTPEGVARSLVARGMRSLRKGRQASSSGRVLLRVCDPAMGGGAFLVEAGRALVAEGANAERGFVEELTTIARSLHGMDVSDLAVATTQAALWLLTGVLLDERQLRHVDALDRRTVGEVEFDWIVGNPPWVSFQGRATQPISAERRATLRADYEAFKGYPTLHGVFLQRATELAPRGVVCLLLPSSLSDLQGYRSARRCLRRTHVPMEPLVEYGEDAFEGVVQPCFGLVAEPRARQGSPDAPEDEPFRLEERAGSLVLAKEVEAPEVLLRLATGPRLPPECFSEMGFQSNRLVTSHLFLRASSPAAPFELPLLEGRVVSSFRIKEPALFLDARPEGLAMARTRLRSPEQYLAVEFVVRQTAAFTIAARHTGCAFRNTLLAGYGRGELDADLLVGLLNSSLYRAFHVGARRDARQATFPQVKVGHLRHLPLPPHDPMAAATVRQLSQRATEEGFSSDLRALLNSAIFRWFGVTSTECQQLENFLSEKAPRALDT